jgi:uncharacterized protein (TIGR02266 family)
MEADRRSHPRFPLILAVQYLGAESVLDYTENLSESGLFIRTEREFEQGERVTLVLSFPQLVEPVELQVEVVRLRASSPDSPQGVAVRIPAELAAEREKLADVLRRVTAAAPGDATLRILLCEDNALVASMYSAALRRLCETDRTASFSIEVVSDGAAAFDRLLRKPGIDLLVTDVFMPVLSGITLVEKIRSEPRLAALPVVVITSGGEKEREQLARLGVALFLQKPVKYQDLVGTIRHVLAAKQGLATPPPAAVGVVTDGAASRGGLPAAESVHMYPVDTKPASRR